MVRKSATRNCKESKNSNRTTSAYTFRARKIKPGSTGNESIETLPPISSSVDNVFQIDLLREKILKYAIRGKSGKISGNLVQEMRLVQKNWLKTTTKLLQKFNEPLIVRTLDGNANGKLLCQRFGASQRLQESFLPVKLHLTLEFFRERNYQSLCDCLKHLGSDLVEIQVEYPKSGGTMPGIFPSFNLPQLRKLTFRFSDEEINEDSDDEEDGLSDNRNGLGLLQCILNASSNLKDLAIPFTKSVNVVPLDFKYIRFPSTSTVSSLDMGIKLKSTDLEVLLKNQLPNLFELKLRLHEERFENALLFNILNQFQNSLQILYLKGLQSDGHPEPVTYLRFPLMKKLKAIYIDSAQCELGPGNVAALQRCLPELTSVTLVNQTKARLSKWTQNSRFENVAELTVSVVNEDLDKEDESYYISPDSEIMTQLHRSFPNISKLLLTLNISDITSLKHIFQSMAQLEGLLITFVGNEAALDSSSDLIDSTFLGLPLWIVAGLKNNMEVLETGAMEIKGGSEPSVKNLSKLDTLFLVTKPRNDAGLEGVSLVSDLLFRYVFMKMSKLQDLSLYGRFKPTLEMEEEWKNVRKCSIDYSVSGG